MFLTTREPNGLYKFLVYSSKKNAEKLLNKKLDLKLIKRSKFPEFSYILFYLKIIFSGVIFSKQKTLLTTYQGIEVGRFIIATSYKDFGSYTSKLILLKNLLKNFFFVGNLFKTSKIYLKKNFDGVYLDHCMYLNGILYSIFAKHNKIVFSNNFPNSIYRIDFRNKKNNYFDKFENSLKLISQSEALNEGEKNKVKVLLDNLTKKPNFLPWIRNVQWVKHEMKNFDIFDYVVYTHSFTDAQLCFGQDDFENSKEWLEFTLNILKKRNKKILIKGHPNYYNESLGILTIWDKKIFDSLKKNHEKHNNFYFINKPVFNYEIAKKIRKDCILISHHGTVLLESIFLGFKTISSSATFWKSGLQISNEWKNKSEYKDLLFKSWDKLNFANNEEFFKLTHKIFFDKYSIFGDRYWQKLIADEVNITLEVFEQKILKFTGIFLDQKEYEKIFNEIIPLHKHEKLIEILSKNISILNS